MRSRFFLYPFSFLYGLVIKTRNFFYSVGIFSSTGFEYPIISVGNLSVGGTGKTPHIEYLIRLLGSKFKLATLSRGYGRKSKGFLIVKQKMSSLRAGDEPLQYKYKFPEVKVVVGENRVKATMSLLATYPDIEAVLLDDAFQHRAIKPGFSVLLTDFKQPFIKDYLLPVGTLREPGSGKKRANIIIVSKTPEDATLESMNRIRSKIAITPQQSLFFTGMKYGSLKPINSGHSEIEIGELKNYDVLAFCGIAKPASFFSFLKSKAHTLKHQKYNDHHQFTEREIEIILKKYNQLESVNKILVTTEKDWMRIVNEPLVRLFDNTPVYTLESTVYFIDPKEKEIFDRKILNYVEKNQPNRIFNRKSNPV